MKRTDFLYDVNIKRLALLTLPTWLRRPLVGALIYAGVSPLVRLFHELKQYRHSTCYRLEHNGQVCKLRSVLNDEFDPIERRIRIEDEWVESSGQRLYCRQQQRYILLPPGEGVNAIVINGRGFGGVSGYDFWVIIPKDLRGIINTTKLNAVINTYKLASKRWSITYN